VSAVLRRPGYAKSAARFLASPGDRLTTKLFVASSRPRVVTAWYAASLAVHSSFVILSLQRASGGVIERQCPTNRTQYATDRMRRFIVMSQMKFAGAPRNLYTPIHFYSRTDEK